MANYGRSFAANVYGSKNVKLSINECKENQFIWCPVYVENVKKEAAVIAAKVIRFNKGGMMIREV